MMDKTLITSRKWKPMFLMLLEKQAAEEIVNSTEMSRRPAQGK